MRKSSSVQLLNLDFNPKEFKVGCSKIDQLPLRRHSASQLNPTPTQTHRHEVELLRKINLQLKQENDQLRRELEGYKLQSTAGTVCNTEPKASYRDIIREKLSSKNKQSRNTECETRLLSSKEVSLSGCSLTISDYFDQYKLAQKVPTLSDLREISIKFF